MILCKNGKQFPSLNILHVIYAVCKAEVRLNSQIIRFKGQILRSENSLDVILHDKI